MSKEAFTPGPWYWGGYPGDIRLQTTHSGRRYVMTFVRKGMQGAQPRFQPGKFGMVDASDLLKFAVGDKSVTGEKEAREDTSVYRYDVVGIDCADAHLIAAAPELYEALKKIVIDEETRRKALNPESPAANFCDKRLSAAKAALKLARGES